MIESWWPVAATLGALAIAVAVGWRPVREGWREVQAQRARREFRVQRERLEAKFFDLAASSGKPRGLRWIDCQWDNTVTFARDRHKGKLTAFVGVTIRFEAVEGGPMEDVPAVANERLATAVFHYTRHGWMTVGRALFNLNPRETMERFREQFEPVPS